MRKSRSSYVYRERRVPWPGLQRLAPLVAAFALLGLGAFGFANLRTDSPTPTPSVAVPGPNRPPPPQFSLVLPGMARDDPGTLVVNSPTARHASDDASSGNSAVAAAGAGGPPAGLAAPPPTAAPTLTATPTAEPTATPTPLPTLDDRPEQGFRSPAEDSGEEADPPPVVTLTPGPPAPQALPPEATPLPEGGS